MGFAVLNSRASLGTEAPPVSVEVFLSGGLPMFSIVGLAQAAVRESKDRVRGAIINSGFSFPQQRITVSLAPADLRKDGGRFDLAIALGILVASRQLPGSLPEDTEYFGELALDGRIRGVDGLLPAMLVAGRDGHDVIVPASNSAEASLAGVSVRTTDSLLSLVDGLRDGGSLPVPEPAAKKPVPELPDIADVRGQAQARRALEIAAAGAHHLLLFGPPGTGKTLLASRLPSVLPAMSDDEALETASVRSLCGERIDSGTFRCRPFRAPHHGASATAVVGGGASAQAGEVSRAHNGVLFLDELPEYRRDVLETLREPMETGRIALARTNYRVELPARFQLVAAMNPCPCGYDGDPSGRCHCSADRIAAYRGKISGPLLDRIDLQVELASQSLSSLRSGKGVRENSETVRTRVEDARQRALDRQGKPNALLDAAELEAAGAVSRASWQLLERASEEQGLSTRSAYRVLRVSRSIADLAGAKRITPPQVAEALALRQFQRVAGRAAMNA